jgi:hypothetical protein
MVSKHQLWQEKHSLEWSWTSHTNSVNVLLVIIVVVKFSSWCCCFFVKCSCSLHPIFFIYCASTFFVLAWGTKTSNLIASEGIQNTKDFFLLNALRFKKKVSTFCPKQPNSKKKFAFDNKLTKVQEPHI